ncbi:DMT family transporter [Halomonas sp.]|uniref:DMT family transporter n=1 Tax=Halomonas sp. TaxID=1486246 RepID=UPI00338E9087
MSDRDRPLAGIVLRIASGVLFAAMLVCVKWVSDEVPLGQVVFYRSAFALLPIVLFLAWRREFPAGLATRRPLGHLLRSSLGAASMFATFAALARLPVAEATLLAQLAPILMAIGGVVLLGERFTPSRALALLLAVGGVAVLVVPDIGNADKAGQLSGYALGVLGASLTAAALVTVRRISLTEGAGAIAFYFVLACTLAGLATLPLGWVALPTQTLTLLILAGLLGGRGAYLHDLGAALRRGVEACPLRVHRPGVAGAGRSLAVWPAVVERLSAGAAAIARRCRPGRHGRPSPGVAAPALAARERLDMRGYDEQQHAVA